MSRPKPREDAVRLGNYVIDHRLGEGASAEVYAAHHARLGHAVAVKVLRPELVLDLRARFENEARALAAIESRHVPQVHDVGSLPDRTPYVVMEHIRGETLAGTLARRGQLPIEEVVEIGTQLVAALGAVHAAGWVHRDVKPSNTVLHHETDGRTVLKLCDFGIATRMSGRRRLTVSGQLVGTPDYMSPEQARGLRVDERADLFSAGAMLYELLTGQSPFERFGNTPHAIAIAVMTEEPVPVTELRPDCPRRLAEVVHRALAKSAAERYPSAQAMADALGEVERRPRRPLRLSLDERMELPISRPWAPLGAGLAAFVLVLVSVVAMSDVPAIDEVRERLHDLGQQVSGQLDAPDDRTRGVRGAAAGPEPAAR